MEDVAESMKDLSFTKYELSDLTNKLGGTGLSYSKVNKKLFFIHYHFSHLSYTFINLYPFKCRPWENVSKHAIDLSGCSGNKL